MTAGPVAPTENLFAALECVTDAERFDTLLTRPGMRLERIVSRGHATPGGEWYDQAWAEWVLLVSGSAVLTIEGEHRSRHLKPGDHLLLPAHVRHRVEATDATVDTVWLALHFSDSAEAL